MKPSFRIENLRESDAERIPALFQEIYGNSYPVPRVYDPGEIIRASAGPEYYPFVARTPDNQIVGFGALYNSAPFSGVFEFGQGIVSSRYQGAGIGRMLFEYVSGYAPDIPGNEVYFGEAVCNHLSSQKLGLNIGTIETGIEVDLMPRELYPHDTTVTGRVAVLDMFKTYVSRPHTVYLPHPYESFLRFLYEGFDDARTLKESCDPLPEGETVLTHQIFSSVQVVRIQVLSAGSDFPEIFSALEQEIIMQQVQVIQVWVNLSWPWAGTVVSILRERGYFTGGLFPRWFNDDGILMQKIHENPNWEGIHLYSSKATRILNYIHKDWSDVSSHVLEREQDYGR